MPIAVITLCIAAWWALMRDLHVGQFGILIVCTQTASPRLKPRRGGEFAAPFCENVVGSVGSAPHTTEGRERM